MKFLQMRLLLYGKIFNGNKIEKVILFDLDSNSTIVVNINKLKGIKLLNCSYTGNRLKLNSRSKLHLSKFYTERGKHKFVGYNISTIVSDYLSFTEREIESQHNKGKSKELVDDLSFLQTRQFKERVYKLADYICKLDGVVDKQCIKYLDKLLYTIFVTVLKHRNGTKYKDMYWLLNTNKGYINFLSKLNSTTPSAISYAELEVEISKHHNKFITIHNHPSSLPPSFADIESNYKHKYRYGIVIGHNGILYLYKTISSLTLDDYNHVYRSLESSIKNESELQFNTLVNLSSYVKVRRF